MTENGSGRKQRAAQCLGGDARKYKVRRNTTLLPETIEWLEGSGNLSGMIDTLVACVRNGSLKLHSKDQRGD